MPVSSDLPTVLVVLVTHDGAHWLPRTLAALAEQSHPSLDVVAVDNGSTDTTRDVLLAHLDADQVLVAERDLGFGAAVSMALDARPAAGPDAAPYVLFLHDDAALAPDAVERLVHAMEADPRLAIVGPKQRVWGQEHELQSVGWTVDLTGRADSGVDPGELDQGQRDTERRSLYVSTSGMLVRRDVFDDLGRFDRRYHLFRDDLDLCWRAWLAGHDVEVVPEAVTAHVAAATNYLRLGQTRFIGPRYFAERNTLATLLKNYGFARLLLVVPLYFLVGVAKVFGFLLTRRVSDAWQTVRAWIWNVLHLAETLRLRREVQSTRRRTDRELRELFGRIIPRVRAYAEAIGEWIAGGDVDHGGYAAVPRDPGEPVSGPRRLARAIKRRPVLTVGAVLTLVVLVGAWPLLLPGELRGGELAPWPASPAAFLADYAAGWHVAGAFGTAEASSPAQAVLGALHLLVFGSSYAAPRLLLLGLPLIAWLLALRAAQGFSQLRLARVVAATAYVLSPPALAALATGRVGALVVLAALPGIVAAGTVLARPASASTSAWRAVAAVVLLGAIAGAFEPVLLPALALAGLLVLALGWRAAPADDPGWRRYLVIRCLTAAVGPFVLLLPWSLRLFADDGPLHTGGGDVVVDELWRWLTLTPDLAGVPAPIVGVGFVLAGLLGLMLGTPRRPAIVATLWSLALTGAVAAWLFSRAGVVTWPGVPLLLTALAYAGLLALAFATAEAQLTRHAFGWRQLAALTTGLAVALALGIVAAQIARGPWEAYAVDQPPLPAFVTAAAAEEGPFRVLVVADDDERGITWEVVDGHGPTMAAYGVADAEVATRLVEPVLTATLSGADPAAARGLGALNVRYVFVPPGGTSDQLDLALRSQFGLEPRPIADGRLFAVPNWLPVAAAVTGAEAADVAAGDLPPTAEVTPLQPDGPAVYRGEVAEDAVVAVAEEADADWAGTVGRTRLRAAAGGSDLLVFEPTETGGRVEVAHLGDTARGVAVAGQLIALLLVVSLALRPPRFARRRDAEPEPPTAPPTAPAKTPEVVA
ncbi:glycosyltransferase family 2 protein [Egicoccus sp. AB-alg2]|uniref:glycosyltransferase family 2 protein n=1 Tax=Egicoccus sp. AB-alg2 TaxID=3242693 RepID=UPI00359E94A7